MVIGLLISSLTLVMVQLGSVSQSYGQFGTQTIQPPGPPTSLNIPQNNQTKTQTGPPGPPKPPGNQTTRTQTGPPGLSRSQTMQPPGNQSTQTRQLPGPPPNQTKREGGGVPPGLMNGWAHSNVTVGARNVTQPFFMNGTYRVRLSHIAINASSGGQIIRNIAFNQTVAQIEFDRNGSIQLMINSSVKPVQVFADNIELSEAQSLNGLTPTSEMWFYDQNNQTLMIFADPSSVTIFYAPVASPIPEFPAEHGLVLVGCLAVILIITKNAAKLVASIKSNND